MLPQPVGDKDELSGAAVDEPGFKGHEFLALIGVHKSVECGNHRHQADEPGQGAVDIGAEEVGLDDIYLVAADDFDQVQEVSDVEAASGVDEDGLQAVLAQGVADPPRASDGGVGLILIGVQACGQVGEDRLRPTWACGVYCVENSDHI